MHTAPRKSGRRTVPWSLAGCPGQGIKASTAHQAGGAVGHEQRERLLSNALAPAAGGGGCSDSMRDEPLQTPLLHPLRLLTSDTQLAAAHPTAVHPYDPLQRSHPPARLCNHDLNLSSVRLVVVVQENVDVTWRGLKCAAGKAWVRVAAPGVRQPRKHLACAGCCPKH